MNQCVLADGRPKKCYGSFDDAQESVTRNLGTSPGRALHAYRCEQHGWHVGHAIRRFDPRYQP